MVVCVLLSICGVLLLYVVACFCERLVCDLIGGYLLLFIFMCSGVCWLRCMAGDMWFFVVVVYVALL